MIKSFKCKETEKVYNAINSKKIPVLIQKRAMIKLNSLDIAEKLTDLKNPPSNYLEALKGNRKGQHSIRINNQFRICFRWVDNNAYDVEVIDYH